MNDIRAVSRKAHNVLIAGGGMAGLTAALCLAGAGFTVELFDQAVRFAAFGAGLQISPNAVAVFERLGLADALAAVSSQPKALRVMSAHDDTELARISLGENVVKRYGNPYFVVHRADLHGILEHACSVNPAIRINMGSRVDSVQAGEHGVTIRVKGEDTISEYTGIGLVAADGVWSKLRSSHFEAPPAPYSGKTAIRGLIHVDRLPADHDLDNVQLWLSPDAHAVTYAIRGRKYLNVVIVVRSPPISQGWAEPTESLEVRVPLFYWNKRFVNLLDLSQDWKRWPLHSAPRLTNWSKGRVALIGDAAHAMLPFAAQGAAMAIEDASELADSLRSAIDGGAGVEQGFADYSKRRRGRVERVAELSEKNGRIYHLPAPLDLARNVGMKVLGGERLLARQDWIFGWTPNRA